MGFAVSSDRLFRIAFFFVVQVEHAHRTRLVQHRLAFLEHGDEALRFLVAACARGFAVARELLLDGGEIGERELGVDRFDVRDRIDLAGDVDDVRVLEAAHDVRDRVGLADVGEELVAEAFAFGGAGDQPRDVDELDDRRHDFLGLHDRRQRVEPRIGHFDDADVRLDRAERIVLGGDAGLGERVEERRLADVGQADDAAFEAHGFGVQLQHGGLHVVRAMRGQTSIALSSACSIALRSSARGGCST